jgi:glycolate oxidase FAD binding subunit
MADILAPKTEAELKDAIRWALSEEAPLEVIGSGTKRALGRAMQTRATLDMSHFAGIVAYEPEELILEAGAATPMAVVEKTLADRGQQLAFEPPDFSRLLGSPHAGTLGGIVACNLSGPRRLKAGAARDHVLGVSGVSGRGDAFKAGARVVKNVTGYDLPKLMTGSWGTLAALTTIIVKVLPRPETEETVAILGLAPDRAIEAMSLAMQSPCEVSGAAHLPAPVAAACGFTRPATLLRLEGVAPSVAYRRLKLAGLLSDFGRAEIVQDKPSSHLWGAIRDVHPLTDHPDGILWRVSVPPSEGASLLSSIPDARAYLDWAGGLIWLELSPSDDGGSRRLRAAIRQGHATLIRAPARIRAAIEVFHPQPPALAALSARVKQAFDPKGILNPGRMYSGV